MESTSIPDLAHLPVSRCESSRFPKFARYLKFNLVGVMGAALQLAVLALLNRLKPTHVALNTAIAVELAVLHNFAWHVRFTWRDRQAGPLGAQLARFHLSNGLISIAGNLLLVKWLVHGHVPVLLADFMAILCCSIFNFCLSDNWIFTGPKRRERALNARPAEGPTFR